MITGSSIRTITVGDKEIGPGQPIYVIAEIANNHQGVAERAQAAMEKAWETGVDAVKFQLFRADQLVTPAHNRYDNIHRVELSLEEWEHIFSVAAEKGITVMADVFDLVSLEFSQDKNVVAYKIHSTDVVNPFMLDRVAEEGKPVLLGVGGSYLDEIRFAIDRLGDCPKALIYGVQNFPTKLEDTNLAWLPRLAQEFGLPVGFADHIAGDDPVATYLPIFGLRYGATFIEKHFCLRRREGETDYYSSLEPDELASFVVAIRRLEKAVGSFSEDLSEKELEYRHLMKKSIVAARDIGQGEEIAENDMAFKRSPEMGLAPRDFEKVLGKKAKSDIPRNAPITTDKIAS